MVQLALNTRNRSEPLPYAGANRIRFKGSFSVCRLPLSRGTRHPQLNQYSRNPPLKLLRFTFSPN